jgi:hypothetical protein
MIASGRRILSRCLMPTARLSDSLINWLYPEAAEKLAYLGSLLRLPQLIRVVCYLLVKYAQPSVRSTMRPFL